MIVTEHLGLPFIDIDEAERTSSSFSHSESLRDPAIIKSGSWNTSRIPLSDELVRSAVASSVECWIGDSKCKPLYLRIRPCGSKSYYLRYPEHQRGDPSHEMLGTIKDYTIAQARLKAERLLRSYEIAGFPKRKLRRPRRNATVDDLFKQYAAQELIKLSRNWATTIRKLVGAYVIPHYGNRSACSISRKEWVELTCKVSLSQTSRGNNLHKALKTFLAWCVERGVLQGNPLGGAPLPAPPTRRRKHLNPKEIAYILEAAIGIGRPWDAIVSLVIATGQSVEEVRNIKGQHINWHEKIWHLERSHWDDGSQKTLVPLNKLAVQSLAPYASIQGHLFPSPSALFESKVISLRTEIVNKIRQRSGALRRDHGFEMLDWNMRDIRRSVPDFCGLPASDARLAVDRWGDRLLLALAEIRQLPEDVVL